MKDEQTELIIAKLTTIFLLILTNKSKIFISILAVHILRRLLKTIHHRRQFPIFTATKPLYCAVCLHDVDRGQRYRRLPQCHHSFHVDCVDTWLQSRCTCPLCRNEIPFHLLPRKKQKKASLLYLFVYYSVKAIRKKIQSNFNKMVVFDAAEL
ncbi:hypothetical protein L1987_39194 [Smallanthus sonchifolius]|uniref:Uncharacterized protein n=1 Tax=Smallanthus sonchifolius TaxID=185202 RepID=A0ACB9HM18_9ASTR|nr:hypothetical protein L1987_39194 [Smallanthus sonchifolius]